MITLVIFSKDRAMQLDSLLRSVKDHCRGIDRVVPIVYASNKLHEDAYWKLAHDDSLAFTELRVQVSEPLGAMVFAQIKGSDHVALAVDDMVFYRPSSFDHAAAALRKEKGFVWSWRLGSPKLRLFGDVADVAVGSEGVDSEQRNVRMRYWTCSPFVNDTDYAYLFHSDGALYRADTYTRMLSVYVPNWQKRAYTPNDFEAGVAAARSDWAVRSGWHLGPLEPTCVTWQLNRAQTAYGSPATEIPATRLDTLANDYLVGKRVDNARLYKMLRENPLQFNPPGARPTHVYACEEASMFYASCIQYAAGIK